MEKWRKLIYAKKGFTLVELIVVVVILMSITAAVVPGFQRSVRQGKFERNILDIVALLDQARTQALASKLDSNQKIPTGGYGVFLDFKADDTQKAVLFVDDWNEADSAAVNVDYADLLLGTRVLPDGIYTEGSDTEIEAVAINSPTYIRLITLTGDQVDGTPWVASLGDAVTVIFKPPYAETTILDNAATSLQNFEAVFKLTTDSSTRIINFNRVTTAPQVIKN